VPFGRSLPTGRDRLQVHYRGTPRKSTHAACGADRRSPKSRGAPRRRPFLPGRKKQKPPRHWRCGPARPDKNLPGHTSTSLGKTHSFKAPGVARSMQSCDGFAEAALRHYLIKATEQGSRAATPQLKWLLSDRPPSISDNAHPPPTAEGRGRRDGRFALNMLSPHPPRQPL
jgi:hypothetical protein